MGSRQYDRYCEQMYQEWLGGEAEADREALENECCCCGAPCGDRYPAEVVDEDTGESMKITDEKGNVEYLCCECAG